MRKIDCIVFLLFLAVPFSAYAQLDTEHWIPPLHSRSDGQVNDHYIYLSTPVTVSFMVTIKDGAGNILATPTIDNLNPFAYNVGSGQIPATPLFVPIDSLNKVLTRSGLTLSAPDVFYANLRVRSGSQADCLTAKGKSAAGTTFRVGGFPQVLDNTYRNLTIGLMATEPNTTITISNYNAGVVFAGVPTVSAPAITFVLNTGECYVVSVYTNTPANLSGFIGALVQSDKGIIMNNGNLLGTIANDGSQDIGIDQSVPVDKVGKNYILIEGGGNSNMEQPIVIAHYDNTGIFVNGNAVPAATLNAGQFFLVPNSNYQGTGHRNMHIQTSEPAYMYQALAGSTSFATGALNFIPPYNCYLEDSLDLIPSVEKIGGTNYTGGVMVFTKQGAVLKINGVVQTGAVPVLSAPWVTYKILGLTGNIKIKSTSGVAAGIFGASGAAGYAGYFSGFSSVPLPTTYTYATYTDTCFSHPISFEGHYSGNIDSLLWDFGDPGSGNNDTSTLQNTMHTFSAPGTYSVKLIVFRCENDTVIHTIRAFSIPTTAFSAADVCFNDTTYFTNNSSVDSSSVNAVYLWSFGDGSPASNLKNPVHYYASPGTYTVTLVTTSGCSDTTTAIVKVFDTPTPVFNFNNVCLSDSALLTNSTLDPVMGNTGSWSWDFGDGSPVNTTSWNPGHLYAAPGNYQLTLISRSSNLGCADTLHDSITIFPMPVADFGFTNVCLGQAVDFTDQSVVFSGTITGRSWDFGDSSPLISTLNPNYTYANPGTFTATLIATNNNGCTNAATKNVVVHSLPVAQFSASKVCEGSIVQFTDLSTILPTDTIQSRAWDFGDGSPVFNNQNTTHLYALNGSYSVQLIVASNFGCMDSISKTSVVSPNPVVSFSASDTAGCEPLCIGFNDASFIAAGGNVKWEWNVGDGSVVNNSPVFDHCYSNNSAFVPALFDVTLTVTSDSGCVSSLSKNNYITVNPTPVANFTVQPHTTTILDPVVSIKDASSGAVLWNWNFGDGSAPFTTGINTDAIPYTYADTGAYTITLIVSTQNNCIDSAYQTIIIEPDVVFYIPNAFTPNGDDINDSFSAKGLFINKYEMTIFDRWGNLVFFTDDIDKPWDGKANHGSEIAQADVYIYSINITDLKKEKYFYKGIVTLVR